MKTVAILLAGGSGKRLGADVPKQFLKVKDKMIIQHTLEAFLHHAEITEIAIVCHADYIRQLEAHIESVAYDKPIRILNGGSERYHSSLSAIKAYDDGEEKNMLFHDGVRPLISAKIISDCIARLEEYNAVGVGIKTTDTVWSVHEDKITSIPDRRTVYRAQTPQGFKFSTIRKAYAIALEDKCMQTTDDCGVVKYYLENEEIAIVEGDERNIKITRKDDLFLFENLIDAK